MAGANAGTSAASTAVTSPEPADLRHQVFEGQLNKFTNVVRGWQPRWFVVRPETGMLDYHLMEETGALGGATNLKVSGKCRGSQHLAGCIVVPSDEDSLTFNAIFASGETYKLRASNVRERQVWVDRIRAVAQLHEKAIAHTHPPVSAVSHSPPPPPPGSKSQLTSKGEPTESLQTLSLSVLEAFGSVHDILHQADLKHAALRLAIERLPVHGTSGPTYLDDDLLTMKAISQAALISLQEALTMLHEIVECNGGSFQLSQGSSHHRKSGHKFLIPQMSPHRRSSKGTKDKGRHQRPESPNRAASPSTNTPRLSMASCDQESASEASSSFHDNLAS